MISIIKRIRSGGQSGVDRAALDIAGKYGVETCGWFPMGGSSPMCRRPLRVLMVCALNPFLIVCLIWIFYNSL